MKRLVSLGLGDKILFWIINVLSAVDIVLSQFTPIVVSQRFKPKEQAEYGKKY